MFYTHQKMSLNLMSNFYFYTLSSFREFLKSRIITLSAPLVRFLKLKLNFEYILGKRKDKDLFVSDKELT